MGLAIGWAITGPRNDATLVLWSTEQGWTYRARGTHEELRELAQDFADARIGTNPHEAEVRALSRRHFVRYDTELGYYGEAEARDGRICKTNRQRDRESVLRSLARCLRRRCRGMLA